MRSDSWLLRFVTFFSNLTDIVMPVFCVEGAEWNRDAIAGFKGLFI